MDICNLTMKIVVNLLQTSQITKRVTLSVSFSLCISAIYIFLFLFSYHLLCFLFLFVTLLFFLSLLLPSPLMFSLALSSNIWLMPFFMYRNSYIFIIYIIFTYYFSQKWCLLLGVMHHNVEKAWQYANSCMVLTLDGSSEHGAHMWSKSGISILYGIWLHRQSRNPYFTSYVRNMF